MLTAVNRQSSSQPLSVLQIDSLWLAFPQYQIASVNLISDIDTHLCKGANVGSTNVGSIIKDKQVWPIYALSSSLSMLSILPKQRRFCVCFHPVASQYYVGLAVDAIASLELHDSLILQSLPDCMQNPRSPVTQIVKNGDTLVFMSDIDYLNRYVGYEESNQ